MTATLPATTRVVTAPARPSRLAVRAAQLVAGALVSGNFESGSDLRQGMVAGLLEVSSDANERPSTAAGAVAPAHAAKVGARSATPISRPMLRPAGTPGPRTNSGMCTDSS